MIEVYLYKLKSGETVIGEFVKAEVINERTGETAHIVRYPMLVPDGNYYNMREWVPGCTDRDYPISMNNMALIIGEESIDGVLVELYDQLTNGEDVGD